jgi:hypothetical protein
MQTRGVAFDNVGCESYVVFGSPQASPTLAFNEVSDLQSQKSYVYLPSDAIFPCLSANQESRCVSA